MRAQVGADVARGPSQKSEMAVINRNYFWLMTAILGYE